MNGNVNIEHFVRVYYEKQKRHVVSERDQGMMILMRSWYSSQALDNKITK